MNNNSRGAVAEFKFATLCLEAGLEVSQPVMDSYAYDFIVGHERLRVQVKTTGGIESGSTNRYKIITARGCKSKKKYTKEEIDIFAIYLSEIDTWYIIPIEFVNSVTVNIYPSREGKYSMFFEAWKYLKRGNPEESPHR